MKSKTIHNWRKKSKDINNFINKENNVFLDNEISIIIKKIRKDLNSYNKIYKNHKLDLLQATNEYKLENIKYKKINNVINLLEKDLESIHKKISKIKKKKIYIISSLAKFRKLLKKEKLEQYSNLLNIGLNGPRDDFYIFSLIKENDEEFYFYLNFLDKYYNLLEKENKQKFYKIQNIIRTLISAENLSFPEDKLIFYISYIIEMSVLKNELFEKSEELKNEELKKIECNIKLNNLESLKVEKNKLVKNVSDYIDLLKNLIIKYSTYENKYKNNFISKEMFYKKVKEFQSLNLHNFLNKKTIQELNNFYINKNTKTCLHYNNRYQNIIPKNKNNNKNKLTTPNVFKNKSQNYFRDISVDYLSKFEGPLTKKNVEIPLNDMFFTLSIDKNDCTEKENISEKSDYESPVSTINITSRKKTLNKIQFSDKTTIDNNLLPNKIPISEFSNNDLNFLHNKINIKKNDIHKIYYKKRPNIRTDLLKSKTKLKIADLEKSTLDQKNYNHNDDGNIGIEKDLILKKNTKKNLFFSKKTNKNKKCFIDKEKLFNKSFSKTFVSKKESLINTLNKDINKKSKIYCGKKISKDKLKKYMDNCDIKDIHIAKNEISNNNIIIQKINNYYGPIYPENYNDTINSYNEEIKQKKYTYLRNNKKTNNYNIYPTMKIDNDIKTENCCLSCI